MTASELIKKLEQMTRDYGVEADVKIEDSEYGIQDIGDIEFLEAWQGIGEAIVLVI